MPYWISTESKFSQDENTELSISFIPAGIETLIKLWHLLKASFPITRTVFGIIKDDSYMQLSKEYSPIL